MALATLLSGLAGAGIASAQGQAGPPEPKATNRAAPPSEAAKEPPKQEAQAPGAGRQRILDDLFQRLEKSEDVGEAKGIAGAIERVWMRSGSDTADLIMERVDKVLRAKDWKVAEELLDKLVDVEPQWAEVWNKRATVRFFNEDSSGAMEDLARALSLEPRHFTALIGVGVILERGERKAEALRVYRRVLAINPTLAEVRSKVDKLAIEVEGRDI